MPKDDLIYVRHKVVHDYLHVDFDIVWDVATADLPTLIAQLEEMVEAT